MSGSSKGLCPIATLSSRATLLWLLAATSAAAQSTGAIRGTVVDGFGHALPDVVWPATARVCGDPAVVQQGKPDHSRDFSGQSAQPMIPNQSIQGPAVWGRTRIAPGIEDTG